MGARRLYGVLRQFCSISLLLSALVALVPASAGHAATLAVSQFYPATRAAYDSWNASTSNARPKETTSFPAGTDIVAFYFEYDGAKPKVTTYGITVRSATGAKLVSRGPYTVRYKDGLAMRYIPSPNGKAFPNGRYHADLLLNGKVRTGTDFVVGGSAVTITTFYAATKASYDAWGATTDSPRPKQSNSFSPGSASIAFYFEYDHAIAKSSQYQITIRNQQGKMIVIHGPYAFAHDAGLHMSLIDGPGGHSMADRTAPICSWTGSEPPAPSSAWATNQLLKPAPVPTISPPAWNLVSCACMPISATRRPKGPDS